MNTTEAEKLAREALTEHGLTANGWQFSYDNAVRRFGCCHYNSKKITLSRKLVELNGKPVVYNTILHEVAHALAGHGAGHGYEWRNTARSIGCDAARCYSAEVIKPAKNFTGTCPNCGREIQRHKRMRIACGTCCRKFNNNRFNSDYLFHWTRNN